MDSIRSKGKSILKRDEENTAAFNTEELRTPSHKSSRLIKSDTIRHEKSQSYKRITFEDTAKPKSKSDSPAPLSNFHVFSSKNIPNDQENDPEVNLTSADRKRNYSDQSSKNSNTKGGGES